MTIPDFEHLSENDRISWRSVIMEFCWACDKIHKLETQNRNLNARLERLEEQKGSRVQKINFLSLN